MPATPPLLLLLRRRATARPRTITPPASPAVPALLILRRRSTNLTPSPPEPVDFLAAIKAQAVAQGLATALTGIYLETASRGAKTPYMVVCETGASLKLKTSSSVIHDTRIQLKLYYGPASAADLADQAEDCFKGVRLGFTGGWSSEWVRSNRQHLKDHALSRLGTDVWFMQVEFTTRVKRGG